MGEIIYKKQFHREPIDETEPEVANFTSELPKKLTLNKLALIGEAEKSP